MVVVAQSIIAMTYDCVVLYLGMYDRRRKEREGDHYVLKIQHDGTINHTLFTWMVAIL